MTDADAPAPAAPAHSSEPLNWLGLPKLTPAEEEAFDEAMRARDRRVGALLREQHRSEDSWMTRAAARKEAETGDPLAFWERYASMYPGLEPIALKNATLAIEAAPTPTALAPTRSFTDTAPSFPYQSSEATGYLGLPDSPEVHLAITALAEQLLPITAASRLDNEKRRIAALRSASGAVLFGHSFMSAANYLRTTAGIPIEPAHEEAEATEPGRNWLAEAADRLRAKGVEVSPRYQTQRTYYGWQELSPGE